MNRKTQYSFRKLSYFLSAVFLLSASVTTLADTDEQLRSNIEELVQVSGMRDQIERAPSSIVPLYHRNIDASEAWDRDDPDQLAILEKAKAQIAAQFTADAYHQAVLIELEDSLSVTQVRELLTYYRSPLGVELVSKQRDAAEKLRTEEFAEFSQNFPPDPLNAKRLEMVEKLIDTTKVHTASANMFIDMEIASILGIAETTPPALMEKMYQERTFTETMDNLEAMRAQMSQYLREVFIRMDYFLTKDISNSEYEKYLNFNLSKTGMVVNQAYQTASRDFVTNTFFSIGESIGHELTNLVRIAETDVE